MSKLIYRTPAEINFADQSATDFNLKTDVLTYRCRFIPQPGADKLFVSLRSVQSQPLFHSDDYHRSSELNGHVLCISDPSLLLDEEIEIGCFHGNWKENPVFGIIGIVDAVASRVGVDKSRIIYWSKSGAALGAALAAINSGTRSILVNALLDTSNMTASRNAYYVAKAFNDSPPEKVARDFPLRSCLPEAIAAANRLGIRSKLFLVQNLSDEAFYTRQYKPFCRRMNIPVEGGLSPDQSIRSFVYSHPSGHAPEPAAVRARIMDEGIPWLLDLS